MKEIMKIVGVVALCNTPMYVGAMAQDANPIQEEMSIRSMGGEEYNIFDEVDQLNVLVAGLTDRVEFLETENGWQWDALNLNSSAIHDNANDINGIKDEMLNVDRYDTVCTDPNFGDTYNAVFKHHYDSTREIEYWKYVYDNNDNFIFGDYEVLKTKLSWLNCNWW